MFYCNYSRDQVWVERAREASGKAVARRWDLPEVLQVSQAWVLYAAELHDATARAHITYSAAPCSLRDATRKFWTLRKPPSKRVVRTRTFMCPSGTLSAPWAKKKPNST
jgi:hypothetical protein